MTFEEFEALLFDLSPGAADELNELTYSETLAQLAQWLVPIMSSWEERAKGMSHEDQNTVLWRIGSDPLFLGEILEDGSSLSIDEQREVVMAAKCVTLAIPKLFAPDQVLEGAYYMWWDFLSSPYYGEEICGSILEVLSELSKHPDDGVQLCALHGLGHLQHPGRVAAVDRYIEANPEAADDPWVIQCRDGTVM